MVHSAQRIQVIDSLRGMAVLGILLMNIPFFALPEHTAMNLEIRQEYSGWNYYTWWIVEMFFHGSMRGLFSMLFGASMMLITRSEGAHGLQAADVYYRRLLWLFLFGLIHGFLLLWPGDILYAYAICGMFLFPFRLMRARWLLLMAGVLLILLTVKITLTENAPLQLKKEASAILSRDTSRLAPTESERALLDKWQEYFKKESLESKQKLVQEEIGIFNGSYAEIFSYLAGITVILESEWMYHVMFLDCFIFMLIGIALYKNGVLTGQKSRSVYLAMAGIGYLIALPLGYLELSTKIDTRFDTIAILEQTPVHWIEIKRLFLTLANMGTFLWIYKMGWFRSIYDWLGSTGRMAFTHYILQTILCGLLFYGFGFGLFNALERVEIYLVAVAIWVFQLAFSRVWLLHFKMGPLEWVWRSAIFWKWQAKM